MTERKSLKRAVRARMAKTGERYTAARRRLLQQKPEAVPSDYDATPRMSDEALSRRTGKTWDEWFAILDRFGATELTHRDIAAYLQEEFDIGGWWAQGITVAYEYARGMRQLHQRPDGFSITATKTVAVPVRKLFEALVEERPRSRWFPNAPLTLRTAQPNRSARFNWEDGATRVNVGFTEKGENKSSVAIEHERLPNPEVAAEIKQMWRELLGDLKQELEA